MNESPVTRTIEWLAAAFAERPYLQADDLAILASQCLARWPLSISDYWEVARKCTPAFKAELEAAWLTPSLWILLSDWTGRGSDLPKFKASAQGALTAARRTELATQVTRISPWLDWSADELSVWLPDAEVALRGWTDAAIKHADPSLYPVLLGYLIENPPMHTALTTKAVTRLISQPNTINDTLCSSMPKFKFSGTTVMPQEKLLLDAWVEALDWSHSGAPGSFSAVKSLIRNAADAWPMVMRTITTLLPATSDKADLVESLLSRLPISPEHQLSASISAIAADLPIALGPVFVGRHLQPQHLLRWLNNSAYAFPVRIQWFHTYKEHIVTDPRLVQNLKDLTYPINNTVALWCFIGATLDAVERTHWKDNGINLDTRARQHNFIAKYAPELLPLLPLIGTIGLSFADALLLIPGASPDTQMPLPENVAENEPA